MWLPVASHKSSRLLCPPHPTASKIYDAKKGVGWGNKAQIKHLEVDEGNVQGLWHPSLLVLVYDAHAEIIASLGNITTPCLCSQHPSMFAAECSHDSLGLLFIPKLRCFGRDWTTFLIPFFSKLHTHHAFQKHCRCSHSPHLLLHTNVFNSNWLRGKISSWRRSAFSCSWVAKSLTLFYVHPLIKNHLFSPTRHKTLPEAYRANTKSTEAFYLYLHPLHPLIPAAASFSLLHLILSLITILIHFKLKAYRKPSLYC